MAIKDLFSKRTTSYDASGHVAPPPQVDQELGTSLGIFIPDRVPELTSRNLRIRTYDQMKKTDAVVSVSLKTAKTSILGAQFYLDPESDEQEAVDIADFVAFNIFERPTVVWTYTLQKILRKFQHGISVFEGVYERGMWAPKRSGANAKNYILLKKLAYRPPLSLKDIALDANGGYNEIIQTVRTPDGKSKEVTIPIEKAVIFEHGDEDDVWGESVLRSAHPHWYYKTHLYKIDGIQKERHGIGVPYGKLPPAYTQDDKKFLQELLGNIRTNEKAEFIIPPGYEIGFAKPEGQLVDVLKSASYHDVAILLNVMAEFMLSGFSESGGGSRANSASQTDVFYKATQFEAELICDCFNNYLIPNLVLWNFQTDYIPKMKVRSIGQARDLQMYAAALANVFGQDIITSDDETENWVRSTVFEMPNRKTPRPEVSPNNIREQILLQGKQGADPNSPTTTGTGTATPNGNGAKGTGARGGNLGKGPTQG